MMTKRAPRMKSGYSQSGLSLIELMIALLLGSLLTIGLVQIFTSNSQTFRTNNATSRVLESGRIAQDMLSHGIRNAGFFGCFPVTEMVNNLDSTHSDYDPATHGFETLGVSAADSATYTERPSNAVANTDFFHVTGVRRPGGIVTLTDKATTAKSLKVADAAGFESGDLAFMSNCENGDLFQIQQVASGSGTATIKAHISGGGAAPGNDLSANGPAGCSASGECLSRAYEPGTELFRAYAETYFIAEGQDEANALFMRDADGSTELAAGVEDMRVRFGTGNAETGVQSWKKGADISSWGDVLALEVSLLISAPDQNVFDAPLEYCFPGWQDCVADNDLKTKAADRRAYRVYTFVSSIRNPH